MGNRRMLDGSFWDDKAIHKRLSRTARYLFIALISHADDEGRVDADPAFLKSRVFLYDDDIGPLGIQAALEEIAAVCNSFCLYETDGEQFVAFLKWEQYQSIRLSRGSRLPAPPVASIAPVSKPGPKRKLHAAPDNDPIGNDSPAILSDGIVTESSEDSRKIVGEPSLTRARNGTEQNRTEQNKESAGETPDALDWRAVYRDAVKLNLSKAVVAAHGDEFAVELARLGADEFKRRLVWWLSVGGKPTNAEKQLEVLRRGVDAMKARPAAPTPEKTKPWDRPGVA